MWLDDEIEMCLCHSHRGLWWFLSHRSAKRGQILFIITKTGKVKHPILRGARS